MRRRREKAMLRGRERLKGRWFCCTARIKKNWRNRQRGKTKRGSKGCRSNRRRRNGEERRLKGREKKKGRRAE